MRLIDADALFRKVKMECNPYGKPTIGFEDGKMVMNWIEQAPTVGGWISVKDRLPDETEDVVVLHEWTGLSGNKYREITLTDLRTFVNTVDRIIAWMPLPEPPEEEKE